MKILIYSIYLPDITDGVSNSTRELVASLIQKDLDVTVCMTDLGWTEKELQKQRSEKLLIFKAWSSSGADFAPDLFVYLMKNCKNFDVVQLHGTFNFPTVFGAYAARISKTPYIVCPRGNFIPTPTIQMHTRNTFFKKLFFKLFAQKSLTKANWVVCSSDVEWGATKEHIHTDNLAYIPNGLNTSTYLRYVDPTIIKDKLGIEPDRPIFLFLGRLSEEKAIPFLIDVWERTFQKIPEACLVIAGASNRGYEKEIAKRVVNLTYPDSVLLPGVVTGDLKLALLQQSRCLLLPSHFESFGNVVLEALISGTPVIASIGTPWKSLEENGFGKWLPWKIKIWTDTILDISLNEDYQGETFSERSRQWVIDNFNWSTIADRYIKLYETIKHNKEAIHLSGL
ncbi:MAG: glycosyltransferase [Candidatus Scalindua sediminis]|nr:glycosyltransferase [Candidatus Scalindua sediminis]